MYRKYMTKSQFEQYKQEQRKMQYMETKTICEVFPDIEFIEIIYKLYHSSAFGKQEKSGTWSVNLESRMNLILDCLNNECSSAGFDLKNEISSMYRNHQNEKSREMHCDGQEAPDHPEQSCNGVLNYTIKIGFK